MKIAVVQREARNVAYVGKWLEWKTNHHPQSRANDLELVSAWKVKIGQLQTRCGSNFWSDLALVEIEHGRMRQIPFLTDIESLLFLQRL